MMEWDINDATIPNTVNHYDPYQDWPDDHIRLVYPLNSEPGTSFLNNSSETFQPHLKINVIWV